MSLKDTDVRTLGDAAIAKKFKLSLARVRQLVTDGAKHEKEHNTNQKKAEEVARDHISERPDYYKMLKKANKTKVSMKEEIGVSGIRGLGNVSGDPAVDPVNQYINTNIMSYVDGNGNKLNYIKKQHANLHNKGLGYNFFDPTNIKDNKNFMSEGISAGPERTQDYSIGDAGGGRTLYRKSGMEEGAKLDKAKKAVMAGVTAANMYTLADVAGRATEGGHGSPKGDIVRAATAAPGAFGWGATALHYGNKGYKLAKRSLEKKKAQMEEEKKMSNPCWKGYKAYGMKKKNGKEVPNCVPVEETAAWTRKAGKNPAVMSEISDTLVGRASNETFWRKKAPSERLSRYIKRAQLRDSKKKEEPKKTVKEQHTIHEDTKMDNTNLINEAIENILENNLIDMKENFKAVLEEKAIEKLEERKKEIAAQYFAQ